MRTLKVNALCGVKNQMYSQYQYISSDLAIGIKDGFFDINSLFWSNIFSAEHVKNLIILANQRKEFGIDPKISVVLKDPKKFLKVYQKSLVSFESPMYAKELYNAMETLEMVCHLHSKFCSAPFDLTISSGYILETSSAYNMERYCLLPFCNPYLSFIEEKIIPEILSYKPKILILTGRPSISSFTIAKIIKQRIPNIFIISDEYESDYYSLKKIKNLLINNASFFSVYNCVNLNNSRGCIAEIEKWYSKPDQYPIDKIGGLIYSLDGGASICITSDNSNICIASKQIEKITHNISILNIKAFENCHCYWNKCSFCGINSKYQGGTNQEWNVSALISTMIESSKRGVKKIWLLDEAIPVDVLREIAEQIIMSKINIIWHVRMRIEPDLADEVLVQMLFQSGLRHILFGFESASPRILKAMNKNSGNFDYLSISEQIVKMFTLREIRVHFSLILGFPAETDIDREQTERFVRYLLKTYNHFSYNINLFYLDVGSKIYQRWESFGILCLSYPCEPRYFLDNHLNWNDSFSSNKESLLEEKREELMKLQYNWYPQGSLIRPSVFYAFWEHSRYELLKKISITTMRHSFDLNNEIILSNMIVISNLKDDIWMLYNLNNHQYITGGVILRDLSEASGSGVTFSSFISRFDNPYKERIKNMILQLIEKDFFVLYNLEAM